MLAAIVYATVPLPEPAAALVIDAHVMLNEAVQLQPLDAVTFTEPVAPLAGTDTCTGAIVYVQDGGGGGPGGGAPDGAS